MQTKRKSPSQSLLSAPSSICSSRLQLGEGLSDHTLEQSLRSEDMEVENNKKLEFSEILKEAIKIPYKNINFIIFTFLTSIPLLCSMFFYEMIFQRTLVEASRMLEPPNYGGYYYYYWMKPIHTDSRLVKDLLLKLVQLGLLYLVPPYISELFSMVVTVNLASKIYIGETTMSLREMAIESIKKTRWEGPLITSFYVLALSTCTLLGFVWLVSNCYLLSRNSSYGVFFIVLYAAAFMAFMVLLKKYLEWSALWNMGIVISTLEGINGTQALMLSNYFSRGSEQRGLLLMLVFFVWGFGLRLSCLCVGCYKKRSIVIAQVFLFCVGDVMKWVVCVVYFFDCKTRILEKKIEEEVGGVENGDAEAFYRRIHRK